MSTPPDSGALSEALDSGDPEARRHATSLLRGAGAGRPEIIRFLLRALGDDDWRVRKEAGQVVTSLSADRELIDALLVALEPGDNVGLRNAAVEALAALGSAAVAPVIATIPRLDPDGRKLAVEILGRARDPSALPALEKCLSDPDPNVRLATAEAIGELGPVSLDAVTRLLRDCLAANEVHVRLAALEALNRLGVVVPFSSVALLLDEPVLRRAALLAAARSGSLEAADVLLSALGDRAPGMFAPALIGLAELSIAAEGAAERLRRSVDRLGPVARQRVLALLADDATLSELGRAAIVVGAVWGLPEALDRALDALVEEVAVNVGTAALRLSGPAAMPRLLAQMASGDSARRVAAIQLVSTLHSTEQYDLVRLSLRQAVEDPDGEVASAALGALGSIGSADDLPTLFALSVRPKDFGQAAQAALARLAVRHSEEARTLARLAARAEPSPIPTCVVMGALGGGVFGDLGEDVAFLSSAVSNADPRVRRVAMEALAQVGSDLGLQAAEYALTDEEDDVQRAAVRALGELRTSDGRYVGVARLLELVRDVDDEDLAVTAIRALGRTDDPRALGALAPLVRSDVARLAVVAVETIGGLSHPDRMAVLTGAIDHPHTEVVKAVLLALEGAGHSAALPCFARALSHQSWDVRRLAADCLGRTGGVAAVDLLRSQAAKEHEPLVREAIDRAILLLETPATVTRAATIAPPSQP